MAFDVITVGNALVDAFLSVHDANDRFRLNQETHEFIIPSGEKILLESCVFQTGGNSANVAVGLSRLGLKTALVAEVGSDEFAEKIFNSLKQEGVETANVQKGSAQTSFSIGLQFQGERTLFVEHTKRKHQFDFSHLQSKWVYLSSLGKEWHEAYQGVISFCRATGAHLALNPGTQQIAEGIDPLRSVFSQAEILFLSLDEAERLFKADNRQNSRAKVQDLLFKLQALGPETVSLTCGAEGSYVLTPEGKIHHLGIIPCTVVEKTGAGDAYASGFLAATIQGGDTASGMCLGTMNAASVVGQIGAQAGLLRQSEIAKWQTRINQVPFE